MLYYIHRNAQSSLPPTSVMAQLGTKASKALSGEVCFCLVSPALLSFFLRGERSRTSVSCVTSFWVGAGWQGATSMWETRSFHLFLGPQILSHSPCLGFLYWFWETVICQEFLFSWPLGFLAFINHSCPPNLYPIRQRERISTSVHVSEAKSWSSSC